MKNAKCSECVNYINRKCEEKVHIAFTAGGPIPCCDDCDFFKRKYHN